MDIISRAEWGARPPRYRYRIPTPTAEHWLHHAAGSKLPGDDRISDADLRRIRAIQDYHMDVRKWSDIAYSFLMDPDGNVFEGRGAGMAGGHTKGRNTVSHALCVMGNYDTQSVDSDLVPRIVQFVRFAHSQGWTPQVFTGGHRDAPDAETSCPGRNLYSKIPEINRLVLEDVMTPDQEEALNVLVALLKSRPTDSPPWGGANWMAYLNEVWTGPTTSDPGPVNPVTHIQLAKVYGVLKSALKEVVPSADVDTVIAEIVDRLGQ